MVTYSVQAISAILAPVLVIQGWPSFKELWDMHKMLVTQLCKIKHPDHPYQGMVGSMMSPEAFALVSITPQKTPERKGEFFMVPVTAITDIDQRTAKQRWIAMKTCETNDDNFKTCFVITFECDIPQVYHMGGTEMGRGVWNPNTHRDL